MKFKTFIPFTLILGLVLYSCSNGELEKKYTKSIKEIENLNDSITKFNNELKELRLNNFNINTQLAEYEKDNLSNNEDFLSFVINFSENENLQIERIEFPIQIENYFIGEKDSIFTITKENWDSKKYKFHPEGFNIYDNEEIKLRNSNYRVLRWYGIESCGDLRFYFKGKNGKWFLYKIIHSG